MQSWTTSKPLATPIAFDTVQRIDLEFVNLRRDAGSFIALVFLNAGELTADAGRDHDNFAGSFTVFTGEQCWGDEGHCDWKRGPVSAFDRRPQHHLTPINVSMDITETVLSLGDPKALEVTIHATRTSDPDADSDVLRFERLVVLSYA